MLHYRKKQRRTNMKTKTIKVTKAEADKLMMLLNRNTCELQNKVDESTDV